MKFKTHTFLITLAVVLCMTALSFHVSANVPTDEELSVNDNVGSKTPLTPSGNLTTVDDVHQVNDEDTIEDKQFITVQSKNGNTFYIIIDRSGDTENVYFLNAVDEADLLALMEDEQKAQVTAVCTCSTKCELGSVNADCPVCSKNKDECIATATTAPAPSEEKKAPEKQQSSTTSLIVLVLFALLGAGGAFYWFKIKNKKSSTKGTTDPNDLYEEDEDYETEDEDTEVETDAEPDYEIEDEDSEISDDERED
ncbi:MAG: DUF4366 domain-containing protein [bacterium]|nr:DUF4366 domain-containing protein [bacterium]